MSEHWRWLLLYCSSNLALEKELHRLFMCFTFDYMNNGNEFPARQSHSVQNGVEWIVIEQDKLRNLNAFDTLTLSYLYLKEVGLV